MRETAVQLVLPEPSVVLYSAAGSIEWSIVSVPAVLLRVDTSSRQYETGVFVKNPIYRLSQMAQHQTSGAAQQLPLPSIDPTRRGDGKMKSHRGMDRRRQNNLMS